MFVLYNVYQVVFFNFIEIKSVKTVRLVKHAQKGVIHTVRISVTKLMEHVLLVSLDGLEVAVTVSSLCIEFLQHIKVY